jgi:hypothetical protein
MIGYLKNFFLITWFKNQKIFFKKSYGPKNVSVHYYIKVHFQILPKFCHFQDFQIFKKVFYVAKILVTLFLKI